MEIQTIKNGPLFIKDIHIDKNKNNLFGGVIKSKKKKNIVAIAYIYKTESAAKKQGKKLVKQINNGVKKVHIKN